jgi:hypothetical protein
MESTDARKYTHGSISALNAFWCKIPSAPAVTAYSYQSGMPWKDCSKL